MSSRREPRRPTTLVGMASLVLGAMLALGGCDTFIGDRVSGLPEPQQWEALPLRGLLTRPSIAVEAIELCHTERCGYDAAVGRFILDKGEADAWRRSVLDPAALARLVYDPDRIGARKGPDKPRIAVERFDLPSWKGSTIAILGERKHAFGVLLERPEGRGLAVILVFAAHADVARRVALAAAG